jgi:aryl-alcohol dehydrogenase
MKISAAVTEKLGGTFSIQEIDLDEPRSSEILVRIVSCAVCHTDMGARDGIFPFQFPGVLGHEGTGVVEEIGADVKRVKVGDHVVLSYPHDGTCPNCMRGKPKLCYNIGSLLFGGTRADGSGESAYSRNNTSINGHFFQQSAYATHTIVTENNAIVVSKDLPLELLTFGCGVITGAGAVLNILNPPSGSTIAIFGAGGVGMNAIMAAVLKGCSKIIAVEPKANRRQLALEIGATHVIDPTAQNPVEAIMALTGFGVNYSLVAYGDPDVLKQAIDSLFADGHCNLIGGVMPGTEAKFDMEMFLVTGKKLSGGVGGDSISDILIPQLIDFYQQGRYPIDKIVKYYPFEQINEAIAASESGEVVKPILLMSKP